MLSARNELQRTPVSSSKRKLEDEFDEDNHEPESTDKQNKTYDSSKKMNMSERSDSDTIAKFETSMFQAEFKQHIIQINTLELDLKHALNEKEKMEFNIESLKKKHEEEKRDLIEAKHETDMSLKSSKSNQKLLNGEIERLRDMAENATGVDLPEREKEIKYLKQQVKDFEEEKVSIETKFKREIENLKHDLNSRNMELDQVNSEILKKIKSNKEGNGKLNDSLKLVSELENKLKDLEAENSKLKDNSENLNQFIDQSKKIDTLERENRTFLADLEYFKSQKEQNLLYKEDLKSKSGQIERYEKKIVTAELEINDLKQEIENLKQTKQSDNSSNLDQFKHRIKELDMEIAKGRVHTENINESVKKLKLTLSEKNDYIDQLHTKLALLNTERNCYKKMLDESEEIGSTDATKVLEKRIQDYETIISHYKKTYNDGNEIKLCNETSIHLEEESTSTSVNYTPENSQDGFSNSQSSTNSEQTDNKSKNKTRGRKPKVINETTINDENEMNIDETSKPKRTRARKVVKNYNENLGDLEKKQKSKSKKTTKKEVLTEVLPETLLENLPEVLPEIETDVKVEEPKLKRTRSNAKKIKSVESEISKLVIEPSEPVITEVIEPKIEILKPILESESQDLTPVVSKNKLLDTIKDTKKAVNSPTLPASLTEPIKMKGRMTKARQAECVALERQRIVRLKLAQIGNDPDHDIEVSKDRPRLVKFAEVVMASNGYEVEDSLLKVDIEEPKIDNIEPKTVKAKITKKKK